MDILFAILLVLHLLGWAVVLGGTLASMRRPGLYPGTLHGILTALVTGVAMVGLGAGGVVDFDPNNAKVAVKLVVALAVGVLVVLARRRSSVPAGWKGAIVGLTMVNVAVAVLWH